MKYPFMFIVMGKHGPRYFVKIAHADYSLADTEWMNDPDLPAGKTFQPSVDLIQESHECASETEALCMIQSWWAGATIEETDD